MMMMMNTTFQPCAIKTCKQISHVLCHCCHKNLCLYHLSNHTNLINYQSNSLTDQINILHEQFKRLNTEKLIDRDRQKLDKWRDNSLKTINRYYEKKCEELDQYYFRNTRQEQNEIDELIKTLLNLDQNEDSTNESSVKYLQTVILEIKNKIDTIEQHGIPIHIRSLPINNTLITIGKSKVQEFDIANLALPYRILNIFEHSGTEMVSNNESLLIDQNLELTLFNRDLRILQRFTWKYGTIRDICWSLGLTSFIIITELNKAFLINGYYLSTNCIELMHNQLWQLCTCSNSLLYLVSLNNAIVEFSLLPSLSYNRRWDQPETCKKDEFIKDIACNDDTLAIVITSCSTTMAYLILRSLTTFDQLLSICLDIKHPSYQLPIRCCPFKNNDWLIIDANTSRLLHVTKDGNINGTLKYDRKPYNAVLFDTNILVIRTDNTINFHEL